MARQPGREREKRDFKIRVGANLAEIFSYKTMDWKEKKRLSRNSTISGRSRRILFKQKKNRSSRIYF